jgi:HAD superfamily hydrolase (TIGR01509 family)
MKKLVVFDVDGLMLNTEFLWQKAWRKTGMEFDCKRFSDLFPKVVGISGSDVDRLLDRELSDIPAEKIIMMRERTRRLGRQMLAEHIGKMPYLDMILDKADELGLEKAVATTTDRVNTMERLGRLGLLSRFTCILCGDEVKSRKPDPEIYETVFRKMNVSPEEAVVLEDTGYGVEAAHMAGADVIMVPSINPASDKEIRIAYAVVRDLREAARCMEKMVKDHEGNV